MEMVAAVPLLIIDDFGVCKLPHTAAEDLLEINMRRYELQHAAHIRASSVRLLKLAAISRQARLVELRSGWTQVRSTAWQLIGSLTATLTANRNSSYCSACP